MNQDTTENTPNEDTVEETFTCWYCSERFPCSYMGDDHAVDACVDCCEANGSMF